MGQCLTPEPKEWQPQRLASGLERIFFQLFIWIVVKILEFLNLGNLNDLWYESTPDKKWWILGLDPASYSQHEDEEERHVT